MQIYLSNEWLIDVPDDYQRRKEGDNLIFWRSGCTLLTTIFAYTGEKHRQTLLANLRAKAEAEKLETIAEDEGEISRFGYLKLEEVMPSHQRLALHAFTTAPRSCLQTSFYLDKPEELRECLLIWNSVEFEDFG
jgi:hypothetical protein